MTERRRRPKVVHLTSVHSPSDPRIMHRECATLAREGYEVVLVAPGPRQTLAPNVRHHPVCAPRNRLERMTRTMVQVYRAARDERADVYHFHDPELIVTGLALRLVGARVIFDVHEDVPADIKTKPWIPSWLRPAVSGFASIALRLVERCFSAIVPATPSIARGFSHRLTVIVRNYPLREELELASDAGSLPLSRRPMAAVYMGSITLLRGAPEMVRAMESPSLPPQARLLLAGEFEDQELRARLTALPGWRRVDAPGMLPRRALGSLLGRARIGLLVLQPAPNHVDAMPAKLFEYMGAGLPVIVSTALEACSDVVRRHDCGILVNPRDCDEIADAMRYLFLRSNEAQAMGDRGRQAVGGRYEWSSEARSLVDLYRKVAS
jgi:glycosyltransferase involved in cell wall biosynthesis